MKFALFASGANFSCAVMDHLRCRHWLPALVVLPEYAPARGINDFFLSRRPGRFINMISDLELAYAPCEQQSQVAHRLRQEEIDFLLVACWPYLIKTEIRDI